jgi:hypothetical protein
LITPIISMPAIALPTKHLRFRVTMSAEHITLTSSPFHFNLFHPLATSSHLPQLLEGKQERTCRISFLTLGIPLAKKMAKTPAETPKAARVIPLSLSASYHLCNVQWPSIIRIHSAIPASACPDSILPWTKCWSHFAMSTRCYPPKTLFPFNSTSGSKTDIRQSPGLHTTRADV